MSGEQQNLSYQMRICATAVYLVCEESVATNISDHLKAGATEIDRLMTVHASDKALIAELVEVLEQALILANEEASSRSHGEEDSEYAQQPIILVEKIGTVLTKAKAGGAA